MPDRPTSEQIRTDFLEFFRQKGHEIVPSGSLVPHDDPTLLFTNAGMNQFKDVFLGTGSRPYKRAVDTQKCLRVSGKHNDLEEVGLDTYHHTFFEMLGNWSFGDYFKREAIRWAWELLTERWGLEPDRLYATVHEGDEALGLEPDEEAARLWREETSIPHQNVLYGASLDNFWMMGDTGPCGPCSEVHIDLRPDEERARTPGAEIVNTDDPRVMELWNLVFIQYNARLEDGRTALDPLPEQHVDTGLGFERICAVLQEKESNYDTDLFAPLLEAIAALSPREEVRGYDDLAGLGAEEAERVRIAMRVIADHARAVAFAVADGASPGNVGRGYVIRRILRRAVRYGYQALGLREPFLWRLVEPLAGKMGGPFPELRERQDYLERTIRAEEEGFLRTLAHGIEMFRETAGRLDPGDTFPGDVAFLLHDTYGFPVDLTALMAREEGLDVDEARFEELMQEQRERARAAGTFGVDHGAVGAWQIVSKGPDSAFVGYDRLDVEGAAIRKMRTAGEGSDARHEVVLDVTPFYAEAGGQIGDTGTLSLGGEEIRVLDTQRLEDGTIAHTVERLPAEPTAPVAARVTGRRRRETMKHHSATHLLHAALREILGPHVQQRGSLVAPERLRFDFSHPGRLSPEELRRIERRVNELIQRNVACEVEAEVPFEEARARGAMALFGEKYGEAVRVVTFDPAVSVELCGGTHVGATGEIGLFRIVSEGSVASGVRRVEAVAGEAALDWLEGEMAALEAVRGHFRTLQQPVEEAVAGVLEEVKALEREVAGLRQQQAAAGLERLLEAPQQVDGVRLVTGSLGEADMDTLREVAAQFRDRLGEGAVAVLGATDFEHGKVYLAAAVSDDLVGRGVQAGPLVGALAKRVGGGGGGRPQLATAGGRQPERLDDALGAAAEALREML